MQKSVRNRLLGVLAAWMILMASCSSYYMVRQVPTERSDYVCWLLEDTSRYVIVHYNNTDLHFFKIAVDRKTGTFNGSFEPVSRNHTSWRKHTRDSVYAYQPSVYEPVGEVHLVIKEDYSGTDGRTQISLDQVSSVTHYVNENKRSSQSKSNGVLILVVVVVGITLFLVFASQSISPL